METYSASAPEAEYLKDAVFNLDKLNEKKSSVSPKAFIIKQEIDLENYKTNWAQIPQKNIGAKYISTNAQQYNNFDLLQVYGNGNSATDLTSEYQINKL